MQTVTRLLSASPTICLSATAQLARPSSSSIPPRFPEKQMTFGRPALAQALMRSIIPGTMMAWCSTRLSPSGIRVTPFAIAQVRPCFWTTGQPSGSSSSTDSSPTRLPSRARSSRAIFS